MKKYSDFAKKYHIEFNDEKWKLYRIILFMECHRAIIKKNYKNFYSENYLGNKEFYIYGSQAAFSRTIPGEICKFSERLNIPITDEELTNCTKNAITNAQKICAYIYEHYENNIAKYLQAFEECNDKNIIGKLINNKCSY